MTTFKNVFNEYINQDDIYDNIVYSKQDIMSLKAVLSICTMFLVAIVGLQFLNEKKLNTVRDESNSRIVIHNQSDNHIAYGDDLLHTQSELSIADQNSFYEKYPFISHLEKNYKMDVYNVRYLNANDIKDSATPLHTVFEFVNGEKEISIRVSDGELSSKYDGFEPSIINNQSVIIYKNLDNYFAVYEKDSLYYQVKSTNLSESEFIETLQLIVED